MKTKYKDRYVLATGYPYKKSDDSVGMQNKVYWGKTVKIRGPRHLFENHDCPRYRLVLECME